MVGRGDKRRSNTKTPASVPQAARPRSATRPLIAPTAPFRECLCLHCRLGIDGTIPSAPIRCAGAVQEITGDRKEDQKRPPRDQPRRPRCQSTAPEAIVHSLRSIASCPSTALLGIPAPGERDLCPHRRRGGGTGPGGARERERQESLAACSCPALAALAASRNALVLLCLASRARPVSPPASCFPSSAPLPAGLLASPPWLRPNLSCSRSRSVSRCETLSQRTQVPQRIGHTSHPAAVQQTARQRQSSPGPVYHRARDPPGPRAAVGRLYCTVGAPSFARSGPSSGTARDRAIHR
jgi:hypothetical protein